MSVKRWVIKDPYDPNPTTNSYLFPRNPKEMSSIYAERAISSMATLRGRHLLFEGPVPAKQWTFSGPILEKELFDDLRHWVYNRKNRLIITDHLGRRITTVLSAIDLVPVRRVNYYYSHDYTVTGLVIGVSEPTVPNVGYIA